MNIAILGGSFDPPHNGYVAIIKNVLGSQKARKIILMPTSIHPFGKKLTLSYHRSKMAKLLEGKNTKVSDFEIKKNSISYSIQTLKALQKQFPKDKIYWIIGTDNLKNFTKWKDWREIIEKFGIIVIPRRNFPVTEGLLGGESQNIIILTEKDFSPINISSSQVRKRIKEEKSIKKMVPREVEKYIIENKLYGLN